jgi:hypothetical protein
VLEALNPRCANKNRLGEMPSLFELASRNRLNDERSGYFFFAPALAFGDLVAFLAFGDLIGFFAAFFVAIAHRSFESTTAPSS